MDIGEKVWERVSEADALVLLGSTYQENLDLYYLTKFLSMDNFLYLNSGGKEYIVVRNMEIDRAEDESRIENVESKETLDLDDDFQSKEGMFAGVIKELIAKENLDVQKIGVVSSFPSGLYEELSEGFDVKVVENPIKELRAVKSREEIEWIRKAQKVTGKSINKVREILAEAGIEGGKLIFKGEVLTSGFLKKEIEHVLIEGGFELVDCIVTSGKKSSQPHFSGKARDTIKPKKPLIVDVFPRSKETRYFGDMTRTFVKGEVNSKLKEMEETVVEAQKIALNKIEAGVKTSEVHKAACEIIRDHGFSTTGKEGKTKFHHSTGHGLGLEIHERPSVAEGNEEKLEEGNVITIEPGLYNPEIGGVRIEDAVVVKKRGYERLSPISKELSI